MNLEGCRKVELSLILMGRNFDGLNNVRLKSLEKVRFTLESYRCFSRRKESVWAFCISCN